MYTKLNLLLKPLREFAIEHVQPDTVIQYLIGIVIVTKLRKYISHSLGFALIMWYMTWLGTVISLLLRITLTQPDLPLIYIAVDVATWSYFLTNIFNPIHEKNRTYRWLACILGGWFFGFTYVDLVVPPALQPNNTIWNICMFGLCFATLCTIIYTEFKNRPINGVL